MIAAEDFDTARDLFTAGGSVEGEIFAPILLHSVWKNVHFQENS